MEANTSNVYDFVIAGGGTAGLVIAARLTENPDISVVVVEAGEDQSEDPRVKTPGMWPLFQNGDMGWLLKTTPQVMPIVSCPLLAAALAAET
jgi:choline dehydrogenase-like flavoprotein